MTGIKFEYFSPLLDKIKNYMSLEHVQKVKDAYSIAYTGHDGQFRSSGDPYITHPVAVACILADLYLDYEAIQAALLHDVVEDTFYTNEHIEKLFGSNVSHIVDGVSKLDKLKFRNRQEAEVANFRKMMMAMTKDVRVVLIKLADRTHNIRTLGSLRSDKQRRIAKETLEIYSNIAGRLGIMKVKQELDSLGFKALHPMRYSVLEKAIGATRNHRVSAIDKIKKEISNFLIEYSIKFEIISQEKNIYSIYNKMVKKEQKFNSIMDIYDFIIITDTRDNCYRILGAIHELFKPIPGKFRDYVSIPKRNGYQSLHTDTLAKDGLPVSIIIRTNTMDYLSKYGVIYYLAQTANESQNGDQVNKNYVNKWIESISEIETNSSFDFINNIKNEIFLDDIFVFTPRGQIIELQKSSTALDFAYAVHTDVGNHAISALVDGKEVKLQQVLRSGQTINILVDEKSSPQASWLSFVKTAKARNKIKQSIHNIERANHIKNGKTYLEQALGRDLDSIPEYIIDHVVKILGVSSLDELLVSINIGDILSIVVAQEIYNKIKECDIGYICDTNDLSITELIKRGMSIELSQCCHPLPGDDVKILSSHKVVLEVHHAKCKTLKNKKIGQLEQSSIYWFNEEQKDLYTAEIYIVVKKTRESIRTITNLVYSEGANISAIYSEDNDSNVEITLLIDVLDLNHLKNISDKISKLSIFVDIIRKINS